MNTIMLCRKAKDEDFDGIYALQNENFVGNLAESERQDGFLSISFSVEQFREMAEPQNGITVVARMDDRVVGFLSAQTCAYNMRIPIPAKLVETVEETHPEIDLEKTLVCGPVCVSKDYRGRGVLEIMYSVLAEEAKGTYDTAITLIAAKNTRSLKAHEVKLGMKDSGSFDFEGKEFRTLYAPFERYLSC